AYDILVTGHESAYPGKAFREGGKVYVDIILNTEMFTSSGSGFAHGASAVGIINHEAEVVFLLEGDYFVEGAKVTGHAEDSFGDDHDSSSCLCNDFLCMLKLLFEALHVIVCKDKPL